MDVHCRLVLPYLSTLDRALFRSLTYFNSFHQPVLSFAEEACRFSTDQPVSGTLKKGLQAQLIVLNLFKSKRNKSGSRVIPQMFIKREILERKIAGRDGENRHSTVDCWRSGRLLPSHVIPTAAVSNPLPPPCNTI